MKGKLLRMLRDQGYRVDTSVLPYYSDRPFSYEAAPVRRDKEIRAARTPASSDVP